MKVDNEDKIVAKDSAINVVDVLIEETAKTLQGSKRVGQSELFL